MINIRRNALWLLRPTKWDSQGWAAWCQLAKHPVQCASLIGTLHYALCALDEVGTARSRVFLVAAFCGVNTWPNGTDLAPDEMHKEIRRSGMYRILD